MGYADPVDKSVILGERELIYGSYKQQQQYAEPLTVRQQPTASHTQRWMFEHCPSPCPSISAAGRPCSSASDLPISTRRLCMSNVNYSLAFLSSTVLRLNSLLSLPPSPRSTLKIITFCTLSKDLSELSLIISIRIVTD